MTERKPVADWATDFDHLDPRWTADPYPIWTALRSTCPVARTERFGGASLPTRYADVRAIAFDTAHFSSRQIILRDAPLGVDASAPPMTTDPPDHRQARHLLSPLFREDAIAALEPFIRQCCREALAGMTPETTFDAAADFAKRVPAQVLARFLGLPQKDLPALRGWVATLLDEGVTDSESASRALAALRTFMVKQMARQRARPGPDVLGHLLRFRKDGQPLADAFIAATLRLLLAAGMDTTAGAIGCALLHLAQHENDRLALAAEPARMPAAVEEFLRLYAPVTMAREVVHAATVAGVDYAKGGFVLLCYPAANRDPAVFPDPDRFDPDRVPNAHFAFGTGIHRCLGADLARLIIRVCLSEWLAAAPAFRLAPNTAVVWSRGSVRGPEQLPVVVG